MNSEDIIVVKDVTIKYLDKYILHNANFVLKNYEWVSCIGCNGAGKTTLIKALIGLEVPHSGRIYTLKRQDIAYMPQIEYTFLPARFTVSDLMIQACTLYDNYDNKPFKYLFKACEKALSDVNSHKLLHMPYAQLSGGQKRSVQVAKCLLNVNFKAIVLDEPFNSIDQINRANIMSSLRDLHKKRPFALFIVSHDVFHIKQYFDRVVHIKDKSLLDCTRHNLG